MTTQSKNILRLYKLALRLGMLGLISSGAWAQVVEMDLSRLWMQDRFMRAMTLAPNQSPQNQMALLDEALEASQVLKNKKVKEISFADVAQFEKFRETYFRSAGSAELDFKNLKQAKNLQHYLVKPESPEMVEHLTNIEAAYRGRLDRQFAYPPQAAEKARQVFFFELLMENSQDSASFVQTLKTLPPPMKLQVVAQFMAPIKAAVANVDTMMDKVLSAGNVSFENPVMGKVVQIILKTYFSSLSPDEKTNLALAVMEKPEDMSSLAVFSRVSRRAGPQFQKLFQVIGRDPGFSEELRHVFSSFEEDLPAAPVKAVEQAKRELQRDSRFKLISFEMEPRKVGSMAQLHAAQVQMPNGRVLPVGVRILKPGIREKVLRENAIFDQVTQQLMADPEIKSQMASLPRVIEDLKQMALAETDVARTRLQQEKAGELYRRTTKVKQADGSEVVVHIEVPKVYFQVGSNTLLMEWANIQSFDKFKKQYPQLVRPGMEVWAKTWTRNAVFLDGFLHADPHMGNLPFQALGPKEVVLWALDYGMTGQLDEALQKKIALFAVADFSDSNLVMARTLRDLSVLSPKISEGELAYKIMVEKEMLRTLGKNVQLDYWIAFGVKNGLEFPQDFTAMGRGLVAIEQGLKEALSPYQMSDVVRQLVFEEPKLLGKFRALPGLVSSSELGQIAKTLGGKALTAATGSVKDSVGGFFGKLLGSSKNRVETRTCDETLSSK